MTRDTLACRWFRRRRAALTSVGMLVLAWGSARAHEDHGPPEAPTGRAAVAPRGSSTSEVFELVAVARGGVLTIYLDRTRTNEPVTTATILTETPDGQGTAALQPDGSYRLPALWSRSPGTYDLTFTVEMPGEDGDVFPVTLAVPLPPVEPAPGGMRAEALGILHDVRAHLAARDPVGFALFGAGAALGCAVMLVERQRRATAALVLTATLAIGAVWLTG